MSDIVNLNSLGRRTDLIFARFVGEVHDRGSYIAIKTPSNPGFHWGNYLIFRSPPRFGDLMNWTNTYRAEFTYYDRIRHMTFTWDSAERGDPSEFLAAGFHLDRGSVLTASTVTRPLKFNTEIEVRPLFTDAEWEQAVMLQLACRESQFDEASYLTFKSRQMAMYRKMSEQEMGRWFGAFLGEQLVGDLGIFHDGLTARFQNVGTHPEFRRQGICGTLVYLSAQFALKDFGVGTLVMEADADYHAARIYESVGFRSTEENFSLAWRTSE